jgi:hypothetical protein
VAAPSYGTPPPVAPSLTRSDAQREFEAWDAASRNPTRASLSNFLAQFPNGRYAAQARTQLNSLGGATATPAPTAPARIDPQAEYDYWERITARGTREAYEEYLRTYPQGRYVDIARARAR